MGGLHFDKNGDSCRAYVEGLANSDADFTGLAETNLSWDKYRVRLQWQMMLHVCFKHYCSAIASTAVHTTLTYKPGGVMALASGPLTDRVISTESNPAGLGCWSFVRLAAKGQMSIIYIVSAYQVFQKTYSNLGTMTAAYQQECIALVKSTDFSDEPKHSQQQFVEDLATQILQWQDKSSCEIVLCINANDDLQFSYKGLSVLADTCQLINLHPDDKNVPTYTEGGEKLIIYLGHGVLWRRCLRMG